MTGDRLHILTGRHGQAPGDFTGGQSLRLMAYKQAKHLQPGGLGERGQGQNGFLRFHISGIIDILR